MQGIAKRDLVVIEARYCLYTYCVNLIIIAKNNWRYNWVIYFKKEKMGSSLHVA